MTYSTKYEMGQEVWAVRRGSFHQIVKCLPCHATGKVTIGEEEFVCPKCNGCSAHPKFAGEKAYTSDVGTIGHICVEDYPDRHGRKQGVQVTYMLSCTGVESGQIWDEKDLFPSREAADAFCLAENLQLPADEAERGRPLL